MTEQLQSSPDPERHWRNRRRMAWLSLSGILAIGLAAIVGFVSADNVPLAQTVCWVLASIVAVYSGGASVVDSMSRVRHGGGR